MGQRDRPSGDRRRCRRHDRRARRHARGAAGRPLRKVRNGRGNNRDVGWLGLDPGQPSEAAGLSTQSRRRRPIWPACWATTRSTNGCRPIWPPDRRSSTISSSGRASSSRRRRFILTTESAGGGNRRTHARSGFIRRQQARRRLRARRPPRREFMVLGGMMIGKNDIPALVQPFGSWGNFQARCRLAGPAGAGQARLQAWDAPDHGQRARRTIALRSQKTGGRDPISDRPEGFGQSRRRDRRRRPDHADRRAMLCARARE